MKKILFIDRDGTLIKEPPIDFQVDSLEKLEFYPEVFQYLSRIYKELDYALVMVSNQDGLGTDAYPEAAFALVQDKVIKAFENEGIKFSEILIDRSFETENLPTRKPGIGMLKGYLNGHYDIVNSYVIGDRKTDVILAQNLGCKAIYISQTPFEDAFTTTQWSEIYQYLKRKPRTAFVTRKTKETDISIALNLDGNGQAQISTGIPFFDHMLVQIAQHGQMDLTIKVNGDLEVDEHHSIEDTALVLGQCFYEALGSKKGIERYGFLLPMDDCLAQVAVDFGGRPWLEWQVTFNREMIGTMPTEMFKHFFKSFSDTAKCNLNIKAEGENEHHKAESIFKAFAKAVKMSIQISDKNYSVQSTKGVL